MYLGVPDGHPAAPTRLDLKRARGGFIPSFRVCTSFNEATVINKSSGGNANS
jgi:hypothetical protein